MSTPPADDARFCGHCRWSRRRFCGLAAGLFAGLPAVGVAGGEDDIRETALRRGEIFADCAQNVSRLLRAWIERKQDPETRLFSRGGVWDYHNEAADHYSSLVLMANYVDPALIQPGGALHATLVNSQRLCVTESGLPTTFDLAAGSRGSVATYQALAEWQRDGLLRVVEVLGKENDWYRELERLTAAMLADAARRGGIDRVVLGHEARGNLLQTLTRLHAISGDAAYLEAAERTAGVSLPALVEQIGSVRVGDHGCELVPGLAELFVLECKLKRPAADVYREPLRQVLDQILVDYAHPTSGLFCQSTTDSEGKRTWPQPTDTWGYLLFAHENYDRATGEGRYRAAIEKPLRWLAENRGCYAELKETLWPRSTSSDDWSDSYESMIVLWNRYREVEGVFEWLDWATRQHVHRRYPDRPQGPYTGGHFDGSTGRTLSMHMMLCSQGVRCLPFQEGLRLGGATAGTELHLSLDTKGPWRGKLYFDGPRCEYAATSLDWARINEMPQWFVVRPEREYEVTVDSQRPRPVAGSTLITGLEMDCDPGSPRFLSVAATQRE